MREDDSIESIAKTLIQAVQASRVFGYILFGVVALYIAAVFATWTIQWLIRSWDAALVLSGCMLAYMAWYWYKWDGK